MSEENQIEPLTQQHGYREISNYLKNELGINRTYVEEVVARCIKNQVKQFLEHTITEHYLNSFVSSAVRDVVTNRSSSYNRASSADQFEKAVLEETRSAVGKLLEKDLKVLFSIQPVPETPKA